MDSEQLARDIQQTASSTPSLTEIYTEIEGIDTFNIPREQIVEGFAEAFDSRYQAATTGVSVDVDVTRVQ